MTEDNTPEETTVVFPVTHDECPVCGSKVRLAALAIQQLVDRGVLHKDSFPSGLYTPVPLIDQARPPVIIAATMRVHTLRIYWDVCECGVQYCNKFEVVEAMIQAPGAQPPMNRHNINPPFGNGRMN